MRQTLRQAARPATTDAASFAAGVLGAKPTAYQYDILQHLATHRRVAVRGPHGLGKTALAAWAVLWALTTFGNDAKIITTASSWRQLSKFLWPEIRKWASRGRWLDREPDMLLQSATCGGAEAFPVASNNADYLEGAHAAKLLYVIDEAKAVPESVFDAIEGAFSTGDCYALAISTPGNRSGRFYDIHRRAAGFEDWWTRHVTVDEAIQSGRINEQWVAARRRQWGESSPVFQSKVLGNFPDQEDDALLSLSSIEAAIMRGEVEGFAVPAAGDRVIGQDVARFGSDDSAQAERVGSVVTRLQTWHGNDTMETAGKARRAAMDSGARLNVDVIGVGSGVVDRLNEINREATTAAQRVQVSGINIGEAASDPSRFVNLRAEIFWKLRERFQDGDIIFSPDIPRDLLDRLTGELTALKYRTNSRGQIGIEGKEEMRKAGLPSPDLADALALAFAPSAAADILDHYKRLAEKLKEKQKQ